MIFIKDYYHEHFSNVDLFCDYPKLIQLLSFSRSTNRKFDFFFCGKFLWVARNLQWRNKRDTKPRMMDVKRTEVTVIQTGMGQKVLIGTQRRIGSVRRNTYFTTGLLLTTSRRENPRPRFLRKNFAGEEMPSSSYIFRGDLSTSFRRDAANFFKRERRRHVLWFWFLLCNLSFSSIFTDIIWRTRSWNLFSSEFNQSEPIVCDRYILFLLLR